MKKCILLAIVSALAGSLVAADSPKSEVSKAAAKLAQQDNYSWTATTKVPESTRFRPGPVEGATEKGGFTYWTSTAGERKMQAAMKGEKRVAINREGEWQTSEELEGAEGAGRFAGAILRGFKLPAAQAEEIAGFAKDLQKDGEVYAGDLTEEGAKALLSFRRRAGGNAPEITNPSGSVKFWVKEGMLTKYEFQVKGSMNFNGNDVDMDRTTTVEIKDIGKSKVNVPEEAKKKLS